MKSVFGLIGLAIPVLYCGGLVIYFSGLEQYTGVPVSNAVGPTMLGLGAIGLLFFIPLVLRIVRLVRGTGAPEAGGGGRAGEAPKDEGSDFDPDAAIARYLAQRGSGPRDPASPTGKAGPPGRRGSAAGGPEHFPPFRLKRQLPRRRGGNPFRQPAGDAA